MNKTQKKVVGVVLESAEPELIEKWCEDGELPTIQRLKERGVWARLRSPSYISSGCAWPTLNVGTSPAKHGIGFFHREIKSGTYRTIKKYADQVHGLPFWITLARAGIRNAIFDLATTMPSPDINGAIVVDWGSEHPSWKTSSFPKDLIDEIQTEIGVHPLADWYQGGLESKQDYENIADKLLEGVQLRTRALTYILDKEDFDFVFCNYSEPHWAGHMFWHLHDSAHPEHDPEIATHLGDAIKQTYKACDRAIAELVERFPDADILVVSNIGIGAHSGGDMMAPTILDRLGLGSDDKSTGPLKKIRTRLFPGGSGQVAAVQRVEKTLRPATIMRLKKIVPERLWDDWTRRLLGFGNTWADSKAFLLPGDNSSLIRINLKGREPRGRVQPGEEYQRLCAQIAEAFMELVDPVSGQRAVEKVVILQEELQGEQIDQLPDIAIVWKNLNVPVQALESPRIGRVDIAEFNKRSGGHWHEGFLIAAGPDLKQGISVGYRDLTDVAPTILALFGLPTPDYMDGTVIGDAFADRVEAIY